MRSVLLAAIFSLLLSACPSVADDTPQEIVQKAIRALGGEDRLGRQVATRYQLTGKLHVGGTEDFAFTGEMFTQPNGDFKYTLDLKANNLSFGFTMVLVGDKGWRSVSGMVEDHDAATLEDMKRSRYYDRVTTLVPLLKDKGFTLTALGETTIKEKAATGIKVAHKGQEDISIFFDKETFLPVKTDYRSKALGDEKATRQETYFSDWREPVYGAEEEKILKSAKLQTDGPALLTYLRKRTPDASAAAQVRTLIDQLGDESFEKREQATAALIEVGAPAISALRQAAESGDAEVTRRAKACLKAIGKQQEDNTVLAAIRLVGRRKPAGAAETLLDWASRLGDDPLGREVLAALAAVAFTDGKPSEILLKALEDKDPQRKAVALAILGKDGGAYNKKPGRRLYLTGLKFPMKAVQFQNGARLMEREYTDIEFFNRFDDGIFAKPK
jgi:hypothetical protein